MENQDLRKEYRYIEITLIFLSIFSFIRFNMTFDEIRKQTEKITQISNHQNGNILESETELTAPLKKIEESNNEVLGLGMFGSVLVFFIGLFLGLKSLGKP